jgi:hypothetical protein
LKLPAPARCERSPLSIGRDPARSNRTRVPVRAARGP